MKDPVEKVMELHSALGVGPLNQFSEPWVCEVGASWIVAVNGTKEQHRVQPDGCMEVPLEPFNFAFWFNGWLAGLMTPAGGSFAAGSAANQESFAAAVDRRIERFMEVEK